MATKLRNLRLERCDLVDRPANPLAQVVIFKRAPVEKSFLDREREYFAAKPNVEQTLAVPPLPPESTQKGLDSPDSGLITALRAVIASSYLLYIAAHSAHWNVEGPNFQSWHAFFGELYEDVFDAIDPFAEALRQHGAFAPQSFAEVLAGSLETMGGPMVSRLISLNTEQMTALTRLRQAADMAADEGLANFCQERLGKHLAYDWKLKAMEK